MLASGGKMRYNAPSASMRVSGALAPLLEGENMIDASWRRPAAALFFSLVAYFVSLGMFASSRHAPPFAAELDGLIPREKWDGTGLNKLTAAEQQALADDISGLMGAARSAQGATPAVKDRSQWRMLHRRMLKDEVRKLLGEPDRISVSRFAESWYYLGGSVTFDSKGRVDFWSEP